MKNIFHVLLSTILLFSTAQAQDKSIRVMTFNIRYDNEGDGINKWSNRKEFAASVIKKYNADIFGLQEALLNQIADLKILMPDFDYVGIGRDDGKTAGEFSPVFFNKIKFSLLDYDTFWLSENITQPGSKSWDAAFPRIVTWIKIKNIFTSDTLFVFNTHFDHIGNIARLNSSKIIIEKIDSLASGYPVLLIGDFNITRAEEPYQFIIADKTAELKDAQFCNDVKVTGPDWTFHGFNADIKREKIDYIFVNPKVIPLEYYIIDDNKDGFYPSDHLPVMISFTIQE